MVAVGDKKLEVFHASAKKMRAKNQITRLMDALGNILEDEEGLVAVAMSYFRKIFESPNLEEIHEAIDNVSTAIIESINEGFTAPVTKGEVNLVLFVMHSEKAPGQIG